MKKAFDILAKISETDGTSENKEINVLDNDSLWNDLEEEDEAEIFAWIERKKLMRQSCFMHSLQLVIRDGLAKIVSSPVLAKCAELASLVHHNALFKNSFEIAFGMGRSIITVNATRWNSLLCQLSAVAELDAEKLKNMLRESNRANLILSNKENKMLNELVSILEPFGEATERTQGISATIHLSTNPTILIV